MDSVQTASRYEPPPEFEQDSFEPLVDLNVDDSTELWLIQWPVNQHPDINGREVDINLGSDGTLGSFKDSSGLAYDLYSCESLKTDATVFLSSQWDSKIVGNISRRVSLVHYPEPEELQKRVIENKKLMLQKTTGTSVLNSASRFSTPTQGSRRRSSHSASKYPASTFTTSKYTLNASSGQPSKPPKRRRTEESSGSKVRSTVDSGSTGRPS